MYQKPEQKSSADCKELNNPSLIEVNHFHLSIANNMILKDVSFTIKDRSILSIVGPSGSGKSTLLHCLNRLIETKSCTECSGSISYHGKPIDSYESTYLRKQIGLIQQKPSPLPFSIEQNFFIPLKEHGVKSTQEMKQIMTRNLMEVGLWEEVKDRLQCSALSLSGGQAQRLCVARAISLQPKVLLMDEPCSALDPISSQVLESLIHQLGSKMAIVVVTHNLAQAKRLKGECLMIWNLSGAGQSIAYGKSELVLTSPTHPLAIKYLEGSIG